MTRNTSPEAYSSRWISEVERELMRRRHVLLYGDVYDDFLCWGTYRSVPNILFHAVLEGFDVVVKYDPIDKYQYADSAMASLFGSAARPATKKPDTPVLGDAPQQPSVGAPKDPARGTSAASPVTASSDADAFGQIRTALRQTSVSVAAIVDLTDMLTRESASFEEGERKLLISLKKCSLDAAIVDKGPRMGFRNTLVLVGGDLKRIPGWLYRDNPYIGLVQIDRPDKEERKQFALRYTRPSNFTEGLVGGEAISDQLPDDSQPHGGTNISPLDRFADEFADLTDGMQTMELEALRLTSHSVPKRLPPGKLQPLIDYFKFGNDDDPWEKLDAKKVSEAYATLSSRVIGQGKAVEAAVDMLTRARVGLSMSANRSGGKPKGIFFFVGPTGVGKTELAKALTQLVFSDEKAFARFDMSEYQQEHAAEKLTGAPPGYVGHEQGGQLTDRVRQHPHSILLFDEIEKAHERVLDKFLQILEDGRLTDGKGDTAYFNRTAIIFTSNRGASPVSADINKGIEAREGIFEKLERLGISKVTDDSPTYEQVSAHFEEEVNFFLKRVIERSELRSRLGDNIIVFDLLRPRNIKDICKKFLDRMKEVAMDKFHLTLQFDDSIENMVLSVMGEKEKMRLGGRQIGTTLESNVELKLNRYIFLKFPKLDTLDGLTVRIGVNSKGDLEVERA